MGTNLRDGLKKLNSAFDEVKKLSQMALPFVVILKSSL